MRHMGEMWSPGSQGQVVFARHGSDPDIVFRDHPSDVREFGFHLYILVHGLLARQENCADGKEFTDSLQGFLPTGRSPGTIVELAQCVERHVHVDAGKSKP